MYDIITPRNVQIPQTDSYEDYHSKYGSIQTFTKTQPYTMV